MARSRISNLKFQISDFAIRMLRGGGSLNNAVGVASGEPYRTTTGMGTGMGSGRCMGSKMISATRGRDNSRGDMMQVTAKGVGMKLMALAAVVVATTVWAQSP